MLLITGDTRAAVEVKISKEELAQISFLILKFIINIKRSD